LAEEGDDRSARAAACFALGNALAVHDLPAAQIRLEEALAIFQAAGDRWGSARALNCLGEVVRVQEDFEQATILYEDALKLFREIKHPWGQNVVLHNLAHIALHRGDFAGAKALLEQVITVSVELNDKCSTANALVCMAEVMSATQQPERAARLFGAAENQLEMINAFIQPGDLPDYERSVATTQEQLDEATFQSAWAEGREMSLEESLDFALQESSNDWQIRT
jgi:non-specific serine/threonine protein kinase